MMKFFTQPPRFVYEKFIEKQKEGVSFVIFLFFLIAFVGSRAWINLSMLGLVPNSFTENVRGVHIHHFTYGIALTSLVGYLVLTLPRHYFKIWRMKLAALFGIGLGWTFDEFGMWLRLRDDYWLRHSYDAIITISILLLNIIYFGHLWKKLLKKILKELPKRPAKTVRH